MNLSSPEDRNKTSIATALSAGTLVAELIARCPVGVPFDAHSVLAEHPELINHKSALLELAYEDFCRRDDMGIPAEPVEFAAQFPTISRSLLHQLEVHRLLADGPSELSSLADREWPPPGQVWLDFELLEELGRGAYSRVYLAREKSLGNRLVVIKATSLGSQEAHTLGMLQHPNIVPVYSMQRDKQLGLTAVCMPYLSRVSLFDVMDALLSESQPPSRAVAMLDGVRRLNGSAVANPEAVLASSWSRSWSYAEAVAFIGIQVAQALQHAHRHGVLHGDVKPSNVLITNSGRALLLDFNLAIFGDESAPFVAGTLPYMAPEQLCLMASRGVPCENALDERADIFSLGMTLFELLNGRSPFGPLPAENSRERLASRLLDRYRHGPIPASERTAQVDHSIQDILLCCLEFDPTRRPQSMDELAGLLGAKLKPRQRIRRWLGRHRQLMIVAATLACAGVLAVSGWQATRDPYPIREWHKGQAAYQRENFGNAVLYLTRALEQDPRMEEARFLRAMARFRVRDLGGAYDDLILLCREPSDGRPRAALAHVVAVREENYEYAAAHYRQAVIEGCRFPVVYNNLGHCLWQAGQLTEAADALRMACSLDRHMGSAYHNLGRVEMLLGCNSRHIIDTTPIEEALRLGPESSELYLDAACLYAIRANSISDGPERGRNVDRMFDLLADGMDRGLTSKKLEEVAGYNRGLTSDGRWSRLNTRPRSDTPFTRSVLMHDPMAELSLPQNAVSPAVGQR